MACYGPLGRATATPAERLWRRFASRQPISGTTIQVLAWCGDQATALGKQALLLVWDNVSWPRSQTAPHGLDAHHQFVKQSQHGVRLVVCRLPRRSPWLNPIEPK